MKRNRELRCIHTSTLQHDTKLLLPLAKLNTHNLMGRMITIDRVGKTYPNGFTALHEVSLDISSGEIFALLGPNGAGKTTLISIICGIVHASQGSVTVNGFDIRKQYRHARSLIGLVPQELTTNVFETVWDTVCFTRGLFGMAPNPAHVEQLLKRLSLWDKKDDSIRMLSGGMKRRVMIAKALAHEPQVLFLDEPTAGVDVELRADMWEMVRTLREAGTTIVLTTHYIEEAEKMADRVGVIRGGEILLTEERRSLMRKFGRKQLTIHLTDTLDTLPASLSDWGVTLGKHRQRLLYCYDRNDDDSRIAELLTLLCRENIHYKDLHTEQSSLEDIFVNLVKTS